jgi:hypothetical protein
VLVVGGAPGEAGAGPRDGAADGEGEEEA